MSKRGYISRYLLILKKLKVKPYSTYEELQCYIENQFDYLQMQDDTLSIGFSKRTFQRDIREISNVFGIGIEYSKSNKGYFISQSETENMNFQHMLEAFNTFSALNISDGFSGYIHFEKRKPKGTENLFGLLHAIKNTLLINFRYQKFYADEISERLVAPYALKEFKNRWYVIAKDDKDEMIKTFGLDRLSELEISKKHFAYPQHFSVEEMFRYCFGIISPDEGDEPQEIILSFDAYQGKYLKTLPLHETQEIIEDNEEELRLKLMLFITHDFLMELLSYGDAVKILSPEYLKKNIRQSHRNALNS